MGRPIHENFKTVEDLERAIDQYFKDTDNDPITKQEATPRGMVEVEIKRPYTIEGLCLALKCHRQTILNYSKKDGYFDTITRAKMKISKQKIEGALVGIYNANFTRFDLVNNSEYLNDPKKDESESDKESANNRLRIEVVNSDSATLKISEPNQDSDA